MPNTQTTQRRRPAVRLVAHKWQAECARLGLVTDTAKAKAFGIDRTSIMRVQNGDVELSATFIAAVLTTLRACRFEDIFEAVSPNGHRS